MENRVHLQGYVKRDASEADGNLFFAIETINEKGRRDIFDCRLSPQSDAWEQLEGFVTEGEEIELIGHLEKSTASESRRMAGVMVEIRQTQTVIYVDHIIEMED